MVNTRLKKYPVQIVLMVSTDVGEKLKQIAEEQQLNRSQVTRTFLHAGMKKAGYTDIITIDGREPVTPTVEETPTDA